MVEFLTSADQVETGLSPVDIANRRSVEEGILLQPERYLLPAPLGDGIGGIQFDRPASIGTKRMGTAIGRLLVVPKADGAARAVTVIADRVRIDRRLQTF